MKIHFFILLLTIGEVAFSQSLKPDLHKSERWTLLGDRHVEKATDDSKKVLTFTPGPADGIMMLNDYQFSNGTIEVDIKGKNAMNQNFAGIAFLIEDDKKHDVVYFRPFNFMNADTVRRWHGVQYVSHPEYPWAKLRADTPLKYETKVHPVPNPDEWFHARITINGKSIKVYVDHSPTPTLEVEKLGTRTSGKIGFWAGPMTSVSFANLEITQAAGK